MKILLLIGFLVTGLFALTQNDRDEIFAFVFTTCYCSKMETINYLVKNPDTPEDEIRSVKDHSLKKCIKREQNNLSQKAMDRIEQNMPKQKELEKEADEATRLCQLILDVDMRHLDEKIAEKDGVE